MSAITALKKIEIISVDRPAQQSSLKEVRETRPFHPHVPSLDGLRFIAAFSVIITHGYWYIVLMQHEPIVPWSLFHNLMSTGANFGMTLFFVLSGFVIHFNYHKTVPSSVSGKVDFFIARFARLYPLFLLVFGFDFLTLLWAQGYFSGYVFGLYNPFRALPFFLTFTQTWWWWPIGPTSASNYYATGITGATGVMWSLSTEAFFYFAYLFCAGVLSRLSGWRLVIVGIAITMYGITFYLFCFTHAGELANWARARFPEASPDEFVHWVLFESPWGRISEFLLGAIAAQTFLSHPIESDVRTKASWLTYGSLGALILLLVGIYGPTPVYGAIGTQCCASLVAFLIYAAARYRSWLSDLLSSPLLVKLGNASYSLYLLHYFILHGYGQWLVGRYPHLSRWMILLAMMMVAFVVSYISYILIERPAIRWIRRNFRPLRFEIWLPVVLTLIVLVSVLVSVDVRALANSDPNQKSGRISISSASFGENCDSKLHNNVLGLMRRVCNGERSCGFEYDIYQLGEPATGCGKRFEVTYSCGTGAAPRQFLMPLFDRPRKRIAFGCR